MLNLKFRSLWLVAGYCLVAFVIYSSLTPNPVTVDVNYFDKYAHTFGYFSLMAWFMQLYHTKKSLCVCAGLLILMGVLLEFVQGTTGYRFFDLYDMLANTLGVLLAWSLAKTPFPKIFFYIETKILMLIK